MAIDRAVLLLAWLVAGCTMGPDFQAQDAAAPMSWFTRHKPAPVVAVDSRPVEAAAEAQWWSLFNDAELTSLEARVAGQSLDVRTATLRLAEARAQRGVVGAAQFPSLNGNASYTREAASQNGVFSALGGSTAPSGPPGSVAGGTGGGAGGIPGGSVKPFDLWQYGLDASWELDIWGKVRREVESADASVEASAEARRGALLSVLAEVARDYIQLRGTQETLRITRANLDISRQALELTRERAAGGLTSDLDVANAQAQTASIGAEIPRLEQTEAQAKNLIAQLLGETPGALDSELAAAPVPPVPPAVPIGLPSELARRRPDIREAEAQLHAATADIGTAKANFYPTITLSGSVSIQALQFRDLGKWASNQYAFGPSITLPIFEGGRLTATLDLRNRQQQEAAVAWQKTVLSAWHDVDNALLAYAAEQRRRDQLRVAVAANQQALGLASRRYRDGISDFLDVLTAQRNLLQAQQQFADSTATVSTNLVALYKALGGGWETTFPAQTAGL